LDSSVFANPNTLKIWLWLLLRAHYKDKVVSLKTGMGHEDVLVKRGKVLFGRNKASDKLDMSATTIVRHIKKLEDLGKVTVKANNHYSIITICKYELYQSEKEETEKSGQPAIQPTTQPAIQPIDVPVDTNKKVNKDNNGKEGKEYSEQVGKNFEFEKLLNPPLFPTWREEVSNFLGDEYFIQQQVKDKKIKYAEVVAHMKQFVYDKNLEGDFKNVKALKKHYGYWYIKHHENRNNQISQSKAFIEVPTDLDYSKMEVW